MAKARVCDRLIMALASRTGVVTPTDIESDLEYGSMYRIATELWRAKKRGAVIKTYRDGRKVTGYELVNVDEMKQYLNNKGFTSFKPQVASATKATVKTVKASAPAKTEVKKVAVAPVDVLDEIDTDITDFEDREFAKSVVDGTI